MSITLNAVVFSFSGFIQGTIARFLNKDAGTPLGFRALTAKVDEPGKDGNYKVRWKLKLPTVTSEASCACPDGQVSELYSDIVVTVPKNCTAAQRTAMATSLKDLTASTEFSASISSLMAPST